MTYKDYLNIFFLADGNGTTGPIPYNKIVTVYDGDVEWELLGQEDGRTIYTAILPSTTKPDYGTATLILNGVEYIGKYEDDIALAFYSQSPYTMENAVAMLQFPGQGYDDVITIISAEYPQSHITITMEESNEWQTLYKGAVACVSDGGGVYNCSFQSTLDRTYVYILVKGTINGVSYPFTHSYFGNACHFGDFSLNFSSNGLVTMFSPAAGDYNVDFQYIIIENQDDGGSDDPVVT